MIIELDGYFHQVLLSGKGCSQQELSQMYLQVKGLTNDVRNIPEVFCRINNFEKLPYDHKQKVDFVIDTDTDTDWIYKPSY
jgi:hypothetical protein